MTIRRFLQNFACEGFDDGRMCDSAFELTLSRRPGMHQVIEEVNELALTREDEDFLRGLGISIRSVPGPVPGKEMSDFAVAAEERRRSPLRA